eukprot:848697_1
MSEEIHLHPLKTKLIELLAENDHEKTITKEAILDLLDSYSKDDRITSNPDKSLTVPKRQVHFRVNTDLTELHEQDDEEDDSEDEKETPYADDMTPTGWTELPSLPTSDTIRYIDTKGRVRSPTEETATSIDINEYDSFDDDDDDDAHPNDDDAKVPSAYLNWSNYALSHLKQEDEEILEYYSNKDLFIVLSRFVLIYTKPGNKYGMPWDYHDKRILNKYELLLIDTKQRDYTTQCYVKCLLPLEGWVYLPQSIINKWITSDKACVHAQDLVSDALHVDGTHESSVRGSNYHRIDMEYVNNMRGGEEEEEVDRRNSSLWDGTQDLNFMKQRIVPLIHPLAKSIVIEEETEEEDVEEKKPNQILNWIVRWIRAHPFFPGLAIVLIQAGIECVIFFDIITDVIVVVQLSRINNSFVLSLFFTFSMVFVLSPYVIGWVSILQFMLRHFYKQLQESKKFKTANILFILFNILPFGVMSLIVGDVFHLLEYLIVRPIAYLSQMCGKWKLELRTISFEELGYWKLRRVSEIYAETIPQSVLQLFLLLFLRASSELLDINVFSVVLALLSSIVVTLFWIAILLFESRSNGMSFVEYMTVVFQGSFKFVPYLPAIERGSKTGIDVNWTRYRLDVDGVGSFAKALQSARCKLRRLKISLYSFGSLHRNACKYFGASAHSKGIQLIISRQEHDIKHLFAIYDIDGNFNFDFAEFARCCLVMRKDVAKSVNLYTVSRLFWELMSGDDEEGGIYLFDLLLKMGSSVRRIPLLDYDNTLHFATKNRHLNLISLLIGCHYDKYAPDEFEKCVIYSVINEGYERYALALCEERGVAIVVEIISAKLLQNYNSFVVVSIGDIELKSQILHNTANPLWQAKLLFIVPFAQIHQIMHHKVKIETVASSRESSAVAGTNEKNDAYNQTLFQINHATVKRERRKSYSATHTMNRVNTLLQCGDDDHEDDAKSDTDDASLKGKLLHLWKANSNPMTQSKRLIVYVKVNHYDNVDDDDGACAEEEIIGGAKLKIDVSQNILKFHKNIIKQKLHLRTATSSKKKFTKTGKLKMRLYLNVLHKYDKCGGLKYIDTIDDT